MKRRYILLLFLIGGICANVAAQETPEPVFVALDDLNLRLNTDFTTDVETPDFSWTWDEAVFEDLTGQCRQLDTDYDPIKTKGYVIVFNVDQTLYRYHSTLTGDILIYCTRLYNGVGGVPRPVTDAMADMSFRPSVARWITPYNVEWRWAEGVFNDASLGCPVPGVDYEAPGRRGYVVTLTTFDGQVWDYRVSSDRQILIYCTPRSGG